MAFCKKNIMLTKIQDINSLQKNVIGVLKIERSIKGVNLNIKFNYLENEDNLCLAIKVGNTTKIFERLSQNAFIFKLNEDVDLNEDINAVVFSKANDIAYLYAGFLGKNKINDLVYYVDRENSKNIKTEEKQVQQEELTPKQDGDLSKETKKEEKIILVDFEKEKQDNSNTSYDDEVIATENYYTLEEIELMDFKKGITEQIDKMQNKNEIYEFFSSFSKSNVQSKEEPIKEQEKIKEEVKQEQKEEEKLEYYSQVETQIEALFSIYPSEENLQKLLTGSRFVKIDFNDDGKYYVVGVIYNDKKPEYICYGVPDNHANGVPNELLGYAEWLPVKIDEENDGYWIMYQDTKEGKCITKTKSE